MSVSSLAMNSHMHFGASNNLFGQWRRPDKSSHSQLPPLITVTSRAGGRVFQICYG